MILRIIRLAMAGAFVLATAAFVVVAFATSRPRTSEAGSDPVPLTALFVDREVGYGFTGETRYVTEDSAWVFRPHVNGPRGELTFSIRRAAEDGTGWSITFAPPQGQQLTVGAYGGVDGRQGGYMDYAEDGLGCPAPADFTIHQLELSASGELAHFAASFEYFCGSGTNASYGELHYRSTDVPIAALVPTQASLAFAAPGATARIELSNVGTTTQHISAAVHGSRPEAFAITGNSCSVLPAAQTCAIDVRFATPESGSVTADLVIRDETTRGQRSIPLDGTGSPPTTVALSVSPPQVAPGMPVTLSAAVANHSGSVTFIVDDHPVATVPVDGSGRSTTSTTLAAGSHWIVATASGPGYGRTTSNLIAFVVQP